jgi:hypothetical protein
MEWWAKGTPEYSFCGGCLVRCVGGVPSSYELASSLAKNDAEVTAYGEMDCCFFSGNEEALQGFAREYLSLPKGEFQTVSGPAFSTDVLLRSMTDNGNTYFYLINTTWKEVLVKLKTEGKGKVTLLRTGAPLAGSIRLPPYALKSFIAPAGIQFLGLEATPCSMRVED